MPVTFVYFYQEKPGDVPVLEWLDDLRRKNERAYKRCLAAIGLLENFGHELRQPTADYLDSGLYELRVREGRVNIRLLYFFDGKAVAIVAHALTKESEIPIADKSRALERKRRYAASPLNHRYRGESVASS